MKTNELFDLLSQHTGKSLLFEYSPGRLVQANYHITEVKHMQIDSVDCGARTDAWKETIIQLWESPEELGKTEGSYGDTKGFDGAAGDVTKINTSPASDAP